MSSAPMPSSAMSQADLARTIDAAFEDRANVGTGTRGIVREAVETALLLLDAGKVRVAEKTDGGWRVQNG